jgi:DNA-binding CsgD family transcriptional regulator
MWNALTKDPGTGIAVLNSEGTVEFANDTIARIFIEISAEEAIGKSLESLFPADFAAERREYIRKVAESGRPILIKSIWKGRRIRSAVHPIPTSDGRLSKMLVITRALTSDDDAQDVSSDFEVIEARVSDLGELQSLTPREIEVLTLIGQGMSIKQIAGTLNRSPKTIENHRHSLGIKLDTTNRVQLARIAYEAGLTATPPRE